MTEPAQREREYRAVACDTGDLTPDASGWTTDVSIAAEIAKGMTYADPPFGCIYIERREVTQPERHITVRWEGS